MRRAEGIIFALATLGEARQAAAGAQRADAVASAGQDLVRITLVANVPDQAIVRGVEYIMDRGGQFDHAEARAQMPAGDRYRRNHFLAQFVGQLAQLGRFQLTQVCRGLDGVQQWRFGQIGH